MHPLLILDCGKKPRLSRIAVKCPGYANPNIPASGPTGQCYTIPVTISTKFFSQTQLRGTTPIDSSCDPAPDHATLIAYESFGATPQIRFVYFCEIVIARIPSHNHSSVKSRLYPVRCLLAISRGPKYPNPAIPVNQILIPRRSPKSPKSTQESLFLPHIRGDLTGPKTPRPPQNRPRSSNFIAKLPDMDAKTAQFFCARIFYGWEMLDQKTCGGPATACAARISAQYSCPPAWRSTEPHRIGW